MSPKTQCLAHKCSMHDCFPSFLPHSDFKDVYFYDYLLLLLELVNTHIVHFRITEDAKSLTLKATLHHICTWENKVTIRKWIGTSGSQNSLSWFNIHLTHVSKVPAWACDLARRHKVDTTPSRSEEVHSQVSETYQYTNNFKGLWYVLEVYTKYYGNTKEGITI